MGHEHEHDSDHSCQEEHRHRGANSQRKAITAAFFITAGFMLVEAAGGFLTGSMALLSDSMHMLADAAALGMSFFASRLASLRPDSARTYGYRRAEVVAALGNVMLLWLLSGYMLRAVYERFYSPVPVIAGPMLAVALLGLCANIVCALILHAHSGENINIRGAFLHVMSDLAGSVAAIGAGAIIYFTGWYRADTIVSLLIIVLILFSSTRLLREAFHILMEGAPRGLSLKVLERELRSIDGVSDVHELHAWSLSSGFNALSAHLVVKDPAKQQAALKAATCGVAAGFGIRHSVFQVEAEPADNSSCDICAH
ncbi:MAG: cation diffusion facilitator family transporter [Elusimicrobia bacterium]|nr:cation diffusion facilitator family transporter [Elusimicrobiota bacterium]